MNKNIVFQCRKCEHHLFILNKVEIFEKLPDYSCPICGEEGQLNWILSHVGDFESEKENYKLIK